MPDVDRLFQRYDDLKAVKNPKPHPLPRWFFGVAAIFSLLAFLVGHGIILKDEFQNEDQNRPHQIALKVLNKAPKV